MKTSKLDCRNFDFAKKNAQVLKTDLGVHSNLVNKNDCFLCLPAGGGETHSIGVLFKS
jgi:hypothetical protein